MRVICPIASVGSYLQPFVVSKPKSLIKVAGKPIIQHSIEKLQHNFAQGTKICFIVGYKKRILIDFLTHLNEELGGYFDISFVEQEPVGYNNDQPLYSGVGDALLQAKEFAIDDDSLVLFTDRLPIAHYQPLIRTFLENGWDGIFNVKEVEIGANCEVCLVDEGDMVQKINEKPSTEKSNLAIQGAFIIGKSISRLFFKALETQAKTTLTKINHGYLPQIQQLINNGAKIGVHRMESEILDFGTIDQFIEGNKTLLSAIPLSQEFYEGLTANGQIQNSQLIAPFFIGKNVKISNSIVGPNVSIGDNTVLNRCVISDCVVGDCSSLENFNTAMSIIGDYVAIENLVKNRLSIGDASSIVIARD